MSYKIGVSKMIVKFAVEEQSDNVPQMCKENSYVFAQAAPSPMPSH